jgi:hypothetical protein
MRNFVRSMATVVALTVSPLALAGLGPNGLGPNGLGPNGLGPNGLGPNGLGPNGLGPNGLGPNGLGPNGLGPNGLGPNGLGPNGLDVNGLGPNGLGPNGLGPNGLIYLITPDGWTTSQTSEFKHWFDADPAAASQYMKYFVRCAYDASTGIAYLDSSGKTWLWTGHFGFAMGSLKSPTLETLPSGQQVTSRMTVEEGKWVSSCLLAHVNLKGTHQYISLRGSPANPEAVAALAPGRNEQWIMGQNRYGGFFADLFTDSPVKYACTQTNINPLIYDVAHKLDTVLGRTCDVDDCTYSDAGGVAHVLTAYLGSCWVDPISPWLTWTWLSNGPASSDPYHFYQAYGAVVALPNLPPSDLRPLFVSGPTIVPLSRWRQAGTSPNSQVFDVDVSGCDAPLAVNGDFPEPLQRCAAADAPFKTRLDTVANVASCGDATQCIGGDIPGATAGVSESFKLVGLRSGQAIDAGLRFLPMMPGYAAGDPATLRPDLAEPVTAIVRYSKDRTGTANIWVTAADGSWTSVSGPAGGPSSVAWPATGAGNWEWLHVYPVYLHQDPQLSAYLGRYCQTTADCAAGLTCGPTNVCSRTTAPNDPTVPGTTCDGGAVPLKYVVTSTGPICVEQCVSTSQCGPGGTCIQGQCVNPAAKVRLSGAATAETCTGAKTMKGDGETGTCNLKYSYFDWKHLKVACREAGESKPICRGEMILDYRKGAWGWFCAYGGSAVYACTAADAPDLDAVGFVPGKPWCAPAGATRFVGICK